MYIHHSILSVYEIHISIYKGIHVYIYIPITLYKYICIHIRMWLSYILSYILTTKEKIFKRDTKWEIKRKLETYISYSMDMTGETIVMAVLKMWLYSIHKREKKIQNLDIDVLS